jgi:hypothetical protein
MAVLRSDPVTAAQGAAVGNSGKAEFKKITRKANGRFRIEFSGTPGATHIIAASSNLANWELVGVAQASGDGVFEFEDANSAEQPARFYKVITPNIEPSEAN